MDQIQSNSLLNGIIKNYDYKFCGDYVVVNIFPDGNRLQEAADYMKRWREDCT